MTEAEFRAILADTTKRVVADIDWRRPDDGHVSALAFRVDVENAAEQPLFIKAWYNTLVPSLSFALIHRAAGRIYGLCLGHEHHNPNCTFIGADVHKHEWSDAARDKQAYRPADITARPNQPVLAWEQFCREARIAHDGTLAQPPVMQTRLF